MSLSESKCWYSNNCLHFLKRDMQFLGFYSLSNVTQTILPVVDSPVVEHLTTLPEIKGSNQAPCSATGENDREKNNFVTQ